MSILILLGFLLFESRSTTDATNFQVLLNTLTTDGDAGVVTVGVTNFIVHENFNPATNVSMDHIGDITVDFLS